MLIMRRFKKPQGEGNLQGTAQVGERFADPFSAGIIMELETIGFNQRKLLQHNIDINAMIRTMEQETRILILKNKASDAKKLNDIKRDMAQLEGIRRNRKWVTTMFKNQGSKRDINVEQFRGNLTMYWQDMVAQVQRKPQKEGATFRNRWLYAGTVYRRMVEPLDIAAFYREGGTDYINNGRSLHYKLLQQWYEEDVKPSLEISLIPRSKRCLGKSSWDNLVKFEEYVMEQIKNYAASPEIFLRESSFMKWWGLYEGYIDTCSNSHGSPLINYMKKRSYMKYARTVQERNQKMSTMGFYDSFRNLGCKRDIKMEPMGRHGRTSREEASPGRGQLCKPSASCRPRPSSFMKRWKELEEVIDTCYRSFMKYGEVQLGWAELKGPPG
ncbi:Senescence-associated carboxylesterase 101 [Vitis vinifera]|uniref:Senescence-associated carboxylesterase 101 n=1 Tax=Vitis vinifera TaxID=29760 RepID=A0A438DWV7_VITVI|nr:Senescence-associated carboxylesterase 101 [Vitis vinifera]